MSKFHHPQETTDIDPSAERPEISGTAQPDAQDLYGSHDAKHDRAQAFLTGETSPGVARIEAINAHLTLTNRICLFIGVFLIAYAYGLDGTVRYTYQVIR